MGSWARRPGGMQIPGGNQCPFARWFLSPELASPRDNRRFTAPINALASLSDAGIGE